MKIGIDINDVLRDNLSQIEYTYNKYIEKDGSDIETNPVTSFDLINHFPMEGGVDGLNRFMYEEAALEIFGHADETHDNLMNRLNLYTMELNDDEEHELCIVSREAVNSVPATFFYLSKTGCRVQNINFSTKYEDIWNDVDVLVTANPILIENKPEGKIAIKIRTTYNGNVAGDYSFDTLMDFMGSHNILENINNIEDINYEQV